jgi:drug/metabolite transporter (DMT)-like permease
VSGRLANVALLVGCGVAWSLVFSLAKIAGSSGHHPLGLTFWQGVGGGLMLLSISALRRRRAPLDARHLGFYLVCGIFGTALPTCLMFVAAPKVGAGILAIVMALVPLLTYGGSILAGIDRAATRRVTGIGLGFGAVLMIVLPEAGVDGSPLLWLLVALAIPASYTAENMVLALKRPDKVDAITLVGVFQLAGAAVLLPVTLATGTFVGLDGPWGAPEWAAVAMFVTNAASYALFLVVLRRTGPVFAAQSAYIITVTGVLWGMALFGERHGPWIWAALAVMLAGMALVQERKVSAPAPAPPAPPRPPRR